MYYGEFNNRSDICREFNIPFFDGVVIHAQYYYEDYSGSAFVIFANGGKFYLVEGSHCSCHGLEEDQWRPDEMSLEVLSHMICEGNGALSRNKHLVEVLERLNDLLDHAPNEIEMWVKLLLA